MVSSLGAAGATIFLERHRACAAEAAAAVRLAARERTDTGAPREEQYGPQGRRLFEGFVAQLITLEQQNGLRDSPPC